MWQNENDIYYNGNDNLSWIYLVNFLTSNWLYDYSNKLVVIKFVKLFVIVTNIEIV